MVEEVHVVKDVLIKLVLPLLVAIMIILAAYFAWSSLVGISGNEEFASILPMSNIPDTIKPSDIGLISYSGIQYASEYFESTMTKLQIENYLDEQTMYTDCDKCQTCDDYTNKCGSCATCQGFEATTFGSCEGCHKSELGINYCAFCYDSSSETKFCNALKNAIKQTYVTGKETDIINLARKENVKISSITDALAKCNDEAIIMETGTGTEKEICYFDKNNKIGETYATGSSFVKADENLLYDGEPYLTFGSDPIHAAVTQQQLVNLLLQVKFVTGTEDPIEGKLLICKGQIDGAHTGFDIMKLKCNPNLPSCELDSTGNCIIGVIDWSTIGDEEIIIETTIIKNVVVPYDGMSIGLYEKTNNGNYNGYDIVGGLYLSEYKAIAYPVKNFKYDFCEFDKNIDPNSAIKIVKQTPFTESSIGRYKIKIGNLKTDQQRNCEFNIYECDSTAFTSSTAEKIVELYDFMREFYIGDVRFETNDLVSYNYYEFELDREYTATEIIKAIEEGADYWIANYLPYYYNSGINLFNMDNNNGIVYDSANEWNVLGYMPFQTTGCSAISTASVKTETPSANQNSKIINYYCPSGKCNNKIKIKTEFKKNNEGRIQPYIWFCGE